jgi:Rrf2 family transcriptional regulator, nitric oxide-sensitive transcriptional repressor
MRLTTRTNLATRVLMSCAVNDGVILRSADIAQRTNASLNHMLQVVNVLQEHGFIETLRGRTGGLRLARAPAQISMGDVFRIFEGNIAFAECFDLETNTCPLHATCRLRGFLTRAVEAFFYEMDLVTLADLVTGNCGLEALLTFKGRFDVTCQTQREVALA